MLPRPQTVFFTFRRAHFYAACTGGAIVPCTAVCCCARACGYVARNPAVPPVRGHHRRLTPVCGVSVAAPAARKRGGGCAIVTEGAPAAAKFTAVSRRRTRRGRKMAHTAATGAGAGAGAGVGSVDSAASGDSSDEDMPAEGGATAADEEPYNDRIHGESGAATFIPLGLAAGDEYYSSGSDS